MDEAPEPVQRSLSARTLAAALLHELKGDTSDKARTLRYELRSFLDGKGDQAAYLPGFEA